MLLPSGESAFMSVVAYCSGNCDKKANKNVTIKMIEFPSKLLRQRKLFVFLLRLIFLGNL